MKLDKTRGQGGWVGGCRPPLSATPHCVFFCPLCHMPLARETTVPPPCAYASSWEDYCTTLKKMLPTCSVLNLPLPARSTSAGQGSDLGFERRRNEPRSSCEQRRILGADSPVLRARGAACSLRSSRCCVSEGVGGGGGSLMISHAIMLASHGDK